MRNLLVLLLFIATAAKAQTTDTTVIKNLEEKMKNAVLQNDTATFFSMFAPEAIVNTPANRCANLPLVKLFTRSMEISYSSYDLRMEKISIVGDVAITMGQEQVVPKDNANHLGKTVTRRYTDIWMKRSGSWLLLGRQATEINVQ